MIDCSYYVCLVGNGLYLCHVYLFIIMSINCPSYIVDIMVSNIFSVAVQETNLRFIYYSDLGYCYSFIVLQVFYNCFPLFTCVVVFVVI